MKIIKKTTKKGFTIIEMVLAMSFISVLLVTIAVLIINIIKQYNKGTTLKNVNSIGRSIMDDLRQSISVARPLPSEDSYYFVTMDATGVLDAYNSKGVTQSGRTLAPNSASGGRLCLGGTTYFWNNLYEKVDGANVTIELSNVNENPSHPTLKLAKVKDNVEYCEVMVDASGHITALEQPALPDEEHGLQELIVGADIQLAIYDMYVYSLARSTVHQGYEFYTVSFTLGTTKGVNITSNMACRPPNDLNSDANFDYCAVNKFSMSMRTSGNTGKRE